VSRHGLLLITALVWAISIGSANADSEVLSEGTASFDCAALYETGQFRDAAVCFETLERQGNTNGHLLYNLGNARWGAGSLGGALVAWRRAELFLPRDGDLAANLESGLERSRDDLPPPGIRSPLGRTLLAPYDALSAPELLHIGVIAWALLFVVLTIRFVRSFPGWVAATVTLAVLTILGLSGWVARSYQTSRHPVAIVLAEEVTLRSGRDVSSTDLAKLHEGAESRVVERSDGWVQVSLSTGLRGWLPAASVGLVQHGPPSAD